jgi:hypothetical protein
VIESRATVRVGITEATDLRLQGASENPRGGHPNTNICLASRLDSESTQGRAEIRPILQRKRIFMESLICGGLSRLEQSGLTG